MEDPDDDVLAALLDDEPIPRPRRTGLRIVGATLLIGLIALLVFVPGGWLNDRGSSAAVHPTTTATDATSVTAATLAEHPEGRRLTAEDWRLQIGATVLIGAVQPDCAGMITSIAGRRYITSARHCLTDVLEKDVVSPEPGQVQEITGRTFDTFHVFDPVSHQRLATLDRIGVGTGDLDVLVATTKDESSAFRARPARTLDQAPRVGDEVATFAASAASGFNPQRLTGVFLGSYAFHDDTGHSYDMDLTGYRQASSAALVGPGHSGSSPTGAGGSAFGPLLFSLNQGTTAKLRAEELHNMGAATGLDLASEGFVGLDETLHLTPKDYLRFDVLLHG